MVSGAGGDNVVVRPPARASGGQTDWRDWYALLLEERKEKQRRDER